MKISQITPNHIILSAGTKLFLFDIKKSQQQISTQTSSNVIDSSVLFEVLDLKPGGSQILSVTCNHTFSVLLIAYSDKKVISYDLSTRSILGEMALRKRPTALGCAKLHDSSTDSSKEVLLVSDKAGDILGVDIPLLKKSVVLGGHTSSVITDLILVGDSEYIITSDRDEKIRVSCFPHAETISMYCLGHTNVITSLSAVSSRSSSDTTKADSTYQVMSCSWDNTLALWDIRSGILLSQVSLVSPNDTISINATDNISHEKSVVSNVVVPVSSADNTNDKDINDNHHTENGNIDENLNAEGDDEGLEKKYDEHLAGNFPLQVVCNNQYVAVIFRNLCEVRLYLISATSSLQYVHTYALTALPVHIFFPTVNTLTVICAKPLYIKSFNLPIVNLDSATNFDSVGSLVSPLVTSLSAAFISFCKSEGKYALLIHIFFYDFY